MEVVVETSEQTGAHWSVYSSYRPVNCEVICKIVYMAFAPSFGIYFFLHREYSGLKGVYIWVDLLLRILITVFCNCLVSIVPVESSGVEIIWPVRGIPMLVLSAHTYVTVQFPKSTSSFRHYAQRIQVACNGAVTRTALARETGSPTMCTYVIAESRSWRVTSEPGNASCGISCPPAPATTENSCYYRPKWVTVEPTGPLAAALQL